MTSRVPPLQPWPLDRLLARIEQEWDSDKAIFSLAGRRFWKAEPGLDLSCDVGGRRVATPVGPAAGPHTQLAQNLALGWLAGARTFELKTVQILDQLDIPRPCIDMEHEGYNVEWSQELALEQSLDEYVKGWLLLAVLRGWEPLRAVVGEPGDHAFELSVGYDLAGIRQERMATLIDGLRAAGPRLDALRGQVAGPFAHLSDVAVDPVIVRAATLSTFHGCPPDEIEAIVEHLMTRHGLDVTVKLNPTLLGRDTVAAILHDRLGYRRVPLDAGAFAGDLQWDRALAMIDRLEAFARREGREFGLKLTNTLVVENHRGVMAGEKMYLSGPPLHVLAVTLLDRLHAALPGRLRLGQATDGHPDRVQRRHRQGQSGFDGRPGSAAGDRLQRSAAAGWLRAVGAGAACAGQADEDGKGARSGGLARQRAGRGAGRRTRRRRGACCGPVGRARRIPALHSRSGAGTVA